MQKNLRQWVATAVVLFINLVLWSIPSDLAFTVARHRDILLGRYTIEYFSGLFALLIISLIVIIAIWSKKPQTDAEKRQGLFKTIALSISIIFSLIVADVAIRVTQGQQYIGSSFFYNRVPNKVHSGIEKDVPQADFSYPNATAGYPEYPYTLTVDKRGFRNKPDLQTYDVAAIGDSFTEGSNVSDDQPWPVLLSKQTGLSVYNLGMSGGNPVSYLETLKRFAVSLHPKVVFCMFYEGNDFRSIVFDPQKIKDDSGQGWSLRKILKSSPIRSALQRCFIKWFGPIGAHRFSDAEASKPGNPLYPVSWLPVTIPDGPNGKHYAFELKPLLEHYSAVSKQDLAKTHAWKNTFAVLNEINKVCRENGIRLIVVYSPDKPHIMMPLLKDKLSPERLREYMAIKAKHLPQGKELMDTVLTRIEIREATMKDYCQQQSIEFVSPTEVLRQGIANGTQAYFTYDQHWAPPGHEIVAKVLSDYLKNSQTK